MINRWLAQWECSLPPASRYFRLPVEGKPELVLEKKQEGWLLAMTLGGALPTLSLGVVLLVLQANSPFSSLLPLRITADTAGDLVLWVEVAEGELQLPVLNEYYEKLCQAHEFYSPLLQSPTQQGTRSAPSVNFV